MAGPIASTKRVISTSNENTGARPTPGMRKFQKSGLFSTSDSPWRRCQRNRSGPMALSTQFHSYRDIGAAAANGASEARATTMPRWWRR